MRYPNKLIPFSESLLYRFPPILEELKVNDLSAAELYGKFHQDFVDISEFVETLDSLFALGKIDIDSETRRIQYVT